MSTDTISHVSPTARSHQGVRQLQPALWPLLAWALVMMAAMLSYFVHLVNEQVARGERLHAAQRSATVASSVQRPATPKGRQERVVATLP